MQPGTGRPPLAGIRIVDLTRLGYGAQATALCGALGAEVIRIESRTRPDPVRVMPPFVPVPGETRTAEPGLRTPWSPALGFDRGGIFFKYNFGGKKSVAIDWKRPRGLALLRRLIATADVLAESFSAGAMARLGLPWAELQRLKPDLVYVSMSGFGHLGRDRAHVTLGPTAQAYTGLTYMLGLPGRRPAGWSFSYLDHMGGYLGAYAVLIGLRHRRRTGEGQHLDVAQIEPGIPLTGAAALDRQANGRTYRRPDTPPGNRSPEPPMAPHGAYPCAGDDAWIAIACRDDDDWRRLREAMGDPAWARDDRFGTVAARRAHEDELDRQVTAFTGAHDRWTLADRLAAAGVPAAPIEDARDRVERDPQLRARGYFVPLPHVPLGEARRRLVHRDLDVLPAALEVARQHRPHDAVHGVDRGALVRLPAGAGERRVVGPVAARRHDAAERHQGEVRRRPIAPRAAQAEGGHGAEDQPRVLAPACGSGEQAEPLEVGRSAVGLHAPGEPARRPRHPVPVA